MTAVNTSVTTKLTLDCIICTFNGAPRVGRLITHLDEMRLTSEFSQIILIDNNSSDDTNAVARQKATELGIRNLIILKQPRQGLAYARIMGIEASSSDIVCFMDDDNLPDSNYAQNVRSAFTSEPSTGIVGCSARLPVEKERPWWWKDYANDFAVGLREKKETNPINSVWGAGMALRRSAIDAALKAGWQPLLIGRCGTVQLSGDDSELCLAMRLAGFEARIPENHTLTHDIASDRLTEQKLLQMHIGFGASAPVLGIYHHAVEGKSIKEQLSRTLSVWNKANTMTKYLFASLAVLLLTRFHILGGKKSYKKLGWQVRQARLKGHLSTLRSGNALLIGAARNASLLRR